MKKDLALDLDQSLVYATSFEERGPTILKYESDNTPLYIYPRQDLEEFMAWAQANFNVRIVTARTNESAKIIMEHFGWDFPLISREQLNPTTIDDWPAFEKRMNNTIVVDDQPKVISGENNTVLAIHPYFAVAPDAELMRIKKNLQTLI